MIRNYCFLQDRAFICLTILPNDSSFHNIYNSDVYYGSVNLVIIIGCDHVFKVLTLTRIGFSVFLLIIIFLSFIWKSERQIIHFSMCCHVDFFVMAVIAFVSDLWTLKNILDGLTGVCYLALVIYSIIIVIRVVF